MSLARAMSKLGALSRTEAARAIEAGRVRLNGRPARDPALRVDPGRDRIALDGKALRAAADRLYLMLHKPRGLVTTRRDERGRPTVYECLQGVASYVFPVGRLDADSEGLLLFTNDTRFGEAVTNPEGRVEKEYRVTVDRPPAPESLRHLREGIRLPDGKLARPRAVRLGAGAAARELTVILDEGKNREIRRLCDAAGLRVERLLRVRIGGLSLGDLLSGRYRPLSTAEVRAVGGGAGRRRGTTR